MYCTTADPGYLSSVHGYTSRAYGEQNLYYTGAGANWEFMTDVSKMNRSGNCVVLYQFGVASTTDPEGFTPSWEIICSKSDEGEVLLKNAYLTDRIPGRCLISSSDWIE